MMELVQGIENYFLRRNRCAVWRVRKSCGYVLL